MKVVQKIFFMCKDHLNTFTHFAPARDIVDLYFWLSVRFFIISVDCWCCCCSLLLSHQPAIQPTTAAPHQSINQVMLLIRLWQIKCMELPSVDKWHKLISTSLPYIARLHAFSSNAPKRAHHVKGKNIPPSAVASGDERQTVTRTRAGNCWTLLDQRMGAPCCVVAI